MIKKYAVTGVNHNSIEYAKSKEQAKITFNERYNNEKVTKVERIYFKP